MNSSLPYVVYSIGMELVGMLLKDEGITTVEAAKKETKSQSSCSSIKKYLKKNHLKLIKGFTLHFKHTYYKWCHRRLYLRLSFIGEQRLLYKDATKTIYSHTLR